MVHESPIITALVLLPKFYNPDEHGNREEIELEKLEQTATEIAVQFEEGGTIHNPGTPPIGFWWDRGFVDRDVLVILEHDIPDTPENREWLETYVRNVLLERFRQKGIYVKYVPVQRVVVAKVLVTEERVVRDEEII